VVQLYVLVARNVTSHIARRGFLYADPFIISLALTLEMDADSSYETLLSTYPEGYNLN
jgi:hypothetical protein